MTLVKRVFIAFFVQSSITLPENQVFLFTVAKIDTKTQSQAMIKEGEQSSSSGKRFNRGISKEDDIQWHGTIAADKQSQKMIKKAKLSGFTDERILRGISREEDMQHHGVIWRNCEHDCVVPICSLTKDGICGKFQ